MPGQGFDTSVFKFVVVPLTSALLINGIVITIFHHYRYILFKKAAGSWDVLYVGLTVVQSFLLWISGAAMIVRWPLPMDATLALIESCALTFLIQRFLISVGGALRQDLIKWRTGTEEGVTFVRERFALWIQLMNIPDAAVEIGPVESGKYTLVVSLPDLTWIDQIPPLTEGVPVVVQLYGRTVLWTEAGSPSIRNGSQPDAIVRRSD